MAMWPLYMYQRWKPRLLFENGSQGGSFRKIPLAAVENGSSARTRVDGAEQQECLDSRSRFSYKFLIFLLGTFPVMVILYKFIHPHQCQYGLCI